MPSNSLVCPKCNDKKIINGIIYSHDPVSFAFDNAKFKFTISDRPVVRLPKKASLCYNCGHLWVDINNLSKVHRLARKFLNDDDIGV